MRKLSEQQVEAFDREYVDTDRFVPVCARIDSDFPDGRFRLLDVGGGNGRFADQILARYPDAHVTVLDNSELLLERNTVNSRKSLQLGSAADLVAMRQQFDLVSMHWLLHHLVGDSYRETRRNQLDVLSAARDLLTDRGRLSIFENNYEGWAPDPAPTYVIYGVTASKAIAPLARALGANTAGTGVCFNSFAGWRDMLAASGLELLSHAEPDSWQRRLPLHARIGLGLRTIRVGYYWARKSVQV
jgi:SAM-dependent methyltransferase